MSDKKGGQESDLNSAREGRATPQPKDPQQNSVSEPQEILSQTDADIRLLTKEEVVELYTNNKLDLFFYLLELLLKDINFQDIKPKEQAQQGAAQAKQQDLVQIEQQFIENINNVWRLFIQIPAIKRTVKKEIRQDKWPINEGGADSSKKPDRTSASANRIIQSLTKRSRATPSKQNVLEKQGKATDQAAIDVQTTLNSLTPRQKLYIILYFLGTDILMNGFNTLITTAASTPVLDQDLGKQEQVVDTIKNLANPVQKKFLEMQNQLEQSGENTTLLDIVESLIQTEKLARGNVAKARKILAEEKEEEKKGAEKVSTKK